MGCFLPRDPVPACFSGICLGSRLPHLRIQEFMGGELRGTAKFPKMHFVLKETSEKFSRGFLGVKYFSLDSTVPLEVPLWTICSLIRPGTGKMTYYMV